MTMRDFIRANRSMIDAVILQACPNVGTINDEESRRGNECA